MAGIHPRQRIPEPGARAAVQPWRDVVKVRLISRAWVLHHPQ
jgi:hypothetical protein